MNHDGRKFLNFFFKMCKKAGNFFHMQKFDLDISFENLDFDYLMRRYHDKYLSSLMKTARIKHSGIKEF